MAKIKLTVKMFGGDIPITSLIVMVIAHMKGKSGIQDMQIKLL